MNIQALLSKIIKNAMITLGAPDNYQAQVRQSFYFKNEICCYQVDSIIALAKILKIKPYKLAKKIITQINLNNIAKEINITRPGFINIILDPKFLSKKLNNIFKSNRLGVNKVKVPQTIVVDYSAPNIAKEMHIGHMRSTIIGDASVRILKFLGNKVIKANHIGDWGTQFGMLIAYIKKYKIKIFEKISIYQLEQLYLCAQKKYDQDQVFAKLSRFYVKKLQLGDSSCRKIWQKLVKITMNKNQKTYNKLNITLNHNDIMGESLYNDMLPNIVSDLQKKGLAIKNNGATVVFLNEFKNRLGNSMGVIIQKKDGAYLYTTIDIACAKYRYEKFKANRIIYYVDSRQHQHLMQVWTIVQKAGYVPSSVLFEHHMFGMILDKNNKPFKTRDGDTIKLSNLIDEAIKRASCIISSKYPNINSIKKNKIAKIIGIGAIKYADLSKNRITNFIFNWDEILSFNGNTAIYIQYAYTRIISIFNKIKNFNKKDLGIINLQSKLELQLGLRLLQLEEIIITVANNGTPHVLCSYLYDIAVLFSTFYENCPIINIDNDQLSKSRLQLALITARIIKKGLKLLGIKTTEYM